MPPQFLRHLDGKQMDYRKHIQSPCTRFLGQGETSKVYRLCTDKACTKCYAAKYAKYSKDEVNRLLVIEKATRKSPFRLHINLLKHAYQLSRTEYLIILDEVLPVYGFKHIGTIAPYLTASEVLGFLLQVFGTLWFLHSYADSFIHMDLHPENIAITAWPLSGPETLVIDGRTYEIPESRIFPVLIDYGHSYTKKEPNVGLWGPGSPYALCAKQNYDIYKLLVLHLYSLVSPAVKPVLSNLIRFLFDKILPSKYIEASTQSIYSAGCKQLLPVTYSDVLQYPGFESFLK